MSEDTTGQETGAEITPVVTPTQEAPAAQAPEGTTPAPAAVPPEGEQSAEENKGKERLSLRFSELTGKVKTAETEREDARREADYWRNLALTGGGVPQTPNPAPQPAADGAPDPSQYEAGEFDPRYVQDLVSFNVKAELKAERQRQTQDQERTTQAERVSGLQQKFFESGLTGAVLIASGGDIPFTAPMADALAVSENPAKIADFLGNNPTEAGRISRLPPVQIGVELARIEARLASPAPTPTPAAQTPVLAGVTPVTDDFSPTMSQADFEASITRKHGDFYGRR